MTQDTLRLQRLDEFVEKLVKLSRSDGDVDASIELGLTELTAWLRKVYPRIDPPDDARHRIAVLATGLAALAILEPDDGIRMTALQFARDQHMGQRA